MSKQKQFALDDIQRKMERLTEIARTIENLPEDFPADNIYESCFDLCIAVPYDLARIRETRRALGNRWKLEQSPHVIDSGTWFADFVNVNDPNLHLTFMADPLKKGATCRRVKSGTKTVDVYTIVCEDTNG